MSASEQFEKAPVGAGKSAVPDHIQQDFQIGGSRAQQGQGLFHADMRAKPGCRHDHRNVVH
ncbi:hypothetical protein, partial [Klebsiella pneumoniae]|uniref:hypothetical protein n=1 Tax=Klebsiella pneumoniae TaxID=573 RepID=UPI003EDE9BAE